MRKLFVILLILCLIPTPVHGAETFKQRKLTIALSADFTSQAVITTPASAPDASGKYPLVILFHGSGPYDMDATYSVAPGTPPLSANFKLIAETLPASGIAVLRFNKRGVGEDGSIDAAQVQKSTLDQLVSDANAVIETALEQPDVDKTRIYLYGWSEGCWVIANVAQDSDAVSGLIMQGTPIAGLGDLLVYQWKDEGLPYLSSTVDTNKDGKLSLTEIALIKPGPVQYMAQFLLYDRASTLEKPLINTYVDQDKDGLVDIQGELAPTISIFLTQMTAYAQPQKASYETNVLVKAAKLPTLVLHGTLDGWTPLAPAEKLTESGAEVIVYKGLGHALSKTTIPAEDAFGVMDSQPLKDMAGWITAQK